jgi:hypothetical protein
MWRFIIKDYLCISYLNCKTAAREKNQVSEEHLGRWQVRGLGIYKKSITE